MSVKLPRLVIAGLSGDSGKTIVSLSLLSALRQKALKLSVFKKGPDYIDAAWLSFAAGTPCRNLDTYMIALDKVQSTFAAAARDSDIAIIEGNRGLFDGRDAIGTHSTAQLAKLLEAPIVLVVNARKATRTIAALVKGCQVFDPDLKIAAVVINNLAGERHQRVVRESIEKYCGLPVLGVVPKLGEGSSLIPGRHLGLVTPAEFADTTELTKRLLAIAGDYLDIDALLAIAQEAEPIALPDLKVESRKKTVVRIGYFKDRAFTFYYPENLEHLQRQGAQLVPISSLEDHELPKIDALYIGGGFPETNACDLSTNRTLMASVRQAAESGMPIYAECGGLIYLCRSLETKDKTFPLAGVFPFDLAMSSRPVGHGYTLLEVTKANPYFAVGTEIKGHEFHYSAVAEMGIDPKNVGSHCCLTVRTGVGLGAECDGLLYKRTLACYTHIHADSVSGWAKRFVGAAREYKAEAESNTASDAALLVEGERQKQTMAESVAIAAGFV